jgi:hypothetical protein
MSSNANETKRKLLTLIPSSQLEEDLPIDDQIVSLFGSGKKRNQKVA